METSRPVSEVRCPKKISNFCERLFSWRLKKSGAARMITALTLFVCGSVLCVFQLAPSGIGRGSTTRIAPTRRAGAEVREAYGRLPLSFEANRGQVDSSIDFRARGAGYTLALSPTKALFVLAPQTNADGKSSRVSLQMDLVGSTLPTKAEGLDELEGKVNYFTGNDPTQWRTNIPTFGRVRYANVYPGIDLVYYGNQKHLEYDLVVAPGGNIRNVKMQFEGAESLDTNDAGELLIHIGGSVIKQRKPLIYQDVDGERVAVNGRYLLQGDSQVGFEVDRYDSSRQLVIDPVLEYSTYLGGDAGDEGNDIRVDISGSAYVCGNTASTNFPTANAIQATFGGGNFVGARDGFVAKLNAAGTALVYSTYLGGSGDDRCNKIAVDQSGNAYVGGETTSSNFPTANAIQATFGGGLSDGFIAKINPAGSALVYSTYLGGTIFDAVQAIAIDSAGNVYSTGRTTSADFPTVNPIQANYTGGPFADLFITKINAAGSALVYSTYLGGTGFEAGFSIAVDAAGAAYLTGQTASSDFPTANPIQSAFGGGSPDGDAFITKINPAGSALVYSTYAGGTDNDIGFEIAIDSSGNAHVVGVTRSANFPVANSLQAALRGTSDGFVMKLNAAGSAFIYSTYLGGTADDSVNGVSIDSSGTAYVAGGTSSTDFPLAAPTQQTKAGGVDAFVCRLTATGNALPYSTYLGGMGTETALAVAVSPAGKVFLTGRTDSTDFPVVNPIQATRGTGLDAFVARLSAPAAQLRNISTRLRVTTGQPNLGIGGFIITGSGLKSIIVRGIGPSLSTFNVQDRLLDPTLSLHANNSGQDVILATNDNWKIADQTQQSQEAQVIATGLAPTNEAESAIVIDLSPGMYTARLVGKGGGTGIGLVEIFDRSTNSGSVLGNISTRAFVDTGDGAMIGGFILGPQGVVSPTAVVIRALGPTLEGMGVTGALSNPNLSLHDQNGTMIAFNEDWQQDGQASQIPANLKPLDTRESALYRILAAGNYTAIVRGSGNSTGVGLVEVYNLP